MGLSKSTRICILLAIDTVFFFIELITGSSVLYHTSRSRRLISASRICCPFSCPRGRLFSYGRPLQLYMGTYSTLLTHLFS